MKHTNLRIGILGAGNISRTHLASLNKYHGVTIAALADTDRELLRTRGEAYGIQKLYRDYHPVIHDPSIDVIDILLPHYLHAEVTVEALKAGKTVICEKPFATNLTDAKRVMKAAKIFNHHVYTKQYFRFAKLHEKASRMILGGAIDRPYLISCTYTTDSKNFFTDPGWRMTKTYAGGGVFMDIGVHILDYLMGMFGSPRLISGFLQRTLPAGPDKGEDVALAIYSFPNNISATLLCTAVDPSFGFGWKKVFFGLGGSITIEDSGKDIMQLTLRSPKHRPVILRDDNWWEKANRKAIEDIISRIRVHEPPLVSLEEAYQGLSAVINVYENAKT